MEHIEFKNYHLDPIFKCIDYPMPFSSGRVRSRLLDLLKSRIDIYDKSRLAIINKYAKRDKSGRIIKSDNGGVEIEKSKIEKLKKEMDKLMQEKILLDINTQFKEDLQKLKKLFYDSPVETTARETRIIVEFCEILESIKDNKKKK